MRLFFKKRIKGSGYNDFLLNRITKEFCAIKKHKFNRHVKVCVILGNDFYKEHLLSLIEFNMLSLNKIKDNALLKIIISNKKLIERRVLNG